MNEEVFTAVREALDTDQPIALVTIVRARGSTPQRVGAKMVVFEDGRTVGTIGGGCYESDAFQRARRAMQAGTSELAHYDLNDDFAEESGLICGGQMDVFIEPIQPAPPLYVIGAGHVGYHVARLGATVGFRVHVVDDRETFANRERFPDAAEVIVDSIPEWLERASLSPRGYAVVVTRGHRHDLDALEAVTRRELHYVGLIGSRAKIARLFERIDEEPGLRDRLGSVHAPIGLDIGAVSPEEIAVAIVAELIAVKYGKAKYKDTPGRDTAPAREAEAPSLKWAPPQRV